LVNVTTPLSRIEVTCDMSGLTSRVGTVLLSGLQSSQTGAAPPQQGRRAPSPRLLRGGRPVAPVGTVRLEDILVVSEDGAEVVTDHPYDLSCSGEVVSHWG